jgi:hypothetical protein
MHHKTNINNQQKHKHITSIKKFTKFAIASINQSTTLPRLSTLKNLVKNLTSVQI